MVGGDYSYSSTLQQQPHLPLRQGADGFGLITEPHPGYEPKLEQGVAVAEAEETGWMQFSVVCGVHQKQGRSMSVSEVPAGPEQRDARDHSPFIREDGPEHGLDHAQPDSSHNRCESPGGSRKGGVNMTVTSGPA